MIHVENLKEVLSSIGFVRSSVGECFRRDYDNCSVIVDFDNKKILYPLTFNLEEPEPFIAAGFRSMIKHNDNTKG